MNEIIRIEYPKTSAGKKYWNKRYGVNAYWKGKHYHERAEDARFWHDMTMSAMTAAHTRKHPFEKQVVITFLWNDTLDLDNHAMMAKMIVDALKGRVITDDSRRWVRGVEHYWHDGDYIKVIVREVIVTGGV